VLIDQSPAHAEFVEVVKRETPWRFADGGRLERYLHNVEHHMVNFVPKLLNSVDSEVGTVFDFGCGSGSGSIALAMIFPELRCQGMDISPAEVSIGRARAALYGVGDRCRFDVVQAGQTLPVPGNAFDLCICCSVLEYIIDPAIRKLCVQEMARIIRPGGFLFVTVPNRLYPVELHSHKLGWNYFPRLLKARIVGSHVWEVRALARPTLLNPHRIPLLQPFTPWTNFCMEKAPR
jgi:ubiquinone/menaquinone biosynthesis C-methylase UbiE